MAANTSLYLLKILQERTDSTRKLSMNEILEILSVEYEVDIDPRQVLRKFDELTECGFPVHRTKGKYSKYWIERDDLSIAELIYLTEIAKNDPHLSTAETNTLLRKISHLVAYNDVLVQSLAKLNHSDKTATVTKSKVGSLHNFRVIADAILEKKQIQYKEIMTVGNETRCELRDPADPIAFAFSDGDWQITLRRGKENCDCLLGNMLDVTML